MEVNRNYCIFLKLCWRLSRADLLLKKCEAILALKYFVYLTLSLISLHDFFGQIRHVLHM